MNKSRKERTRVIFTCNRRGNAIGYLSERVGSLASRWKTLVDFIYVYIHTYVCVCVCVCVYIIYIQLSCYRPGSELTDHTEYALAVAFVSVGVVCQRNEQTRFVDITRRLDNSSPSTKTRSAYSRLNAECQYVYEQNLLIDTLTNSRLSFTSWERINLELRARGELSNRRRIFDLKYHFCRSVSLIVLFTRCPR